MSAVTSSSATADEARKILSHVRTIRSLAALDGTFNEIVVFIEAQAKKLPHMPSTSPVLPEPSGLHSEQQGHPQRHKWFSPVRTCLSMCAVLVSALCRRVDELLTAKANSLAYSDVAGPLSSSTGAGSITGDTDDPDRVHQYMETLRQLLLSLDTAAVNAILSAGSSKPQPVVAQSGAAASPALLILSYGIDEVNDYAYSQRRRAEARLQKVMEQPFWNLPAISLALQDASIAERNLADTLGSTGGNSGSGRAGFLRRYKAAVAMDGDQVLEATRVITPLRDPISMAVIRLPARGPNCVHLEVFDAATFVQSVQQHQSKQRQLVLGGEGKPSASGKCPYCRSLVPLVELRVDLLALDAMRQFLASNDGASSSTATVAADDALEWDLELESVRVIADGGRLAADTATERIGDEDNSESVRHSGTLSMAGQAHARQHGPSDGTAATGPKRRRVEVGGRVLYVEER